MNPPRTPDKLPDPWHYDSEKLLAELERIQGVINTIPISDPTATHFGINRAATALYDLTSNLRYLLYLHREGQRSFARQHDEKEQMTLGKPNGKERKIVRLRA